MPRKGNYRKQSRRSYGFSRGVRDVASIAATASTALKIATTVAGLINVEFKYLDSSFTGNVTSTAAFTRLTAIAQGDGVSSRDGQEVQLKSIQLRGVTFPNATGVNEVCRFMIVKDTKVQDNSTPALTDILSGSSPWDLRNVSLQNRFIVIYDKIITFNGAADAPQVFEYYTDKEQVHLRYTGTGSTDWVGCHYWLVVFSNLGTNPPTANIEARIRYIDN